MGNRDGLLSAHSWAEAGLRVSLAEILARYFTLHKCSQNKCPAPPAGSELAKAACPTGLEVEPCSCQQNRREQILISMGYIRNLKLQTVPGSGARAGGCGEDPHHLPLSGRDIYIRCMMQTLNGPWSHTADKRPQAWPFLLTLEQGPAQGGRKGYRQ